MVEVDGLEPPSAEPKSAVLPLDETSILEPSAGIEPATKHLTRVPPYR